MAGKLTIKQDYCLAGDYEPVGDYETAFILKQGTLVCPEDKAHLEFMGIANMRLKREIEPGTYAYDAKCPTCQRKFDVLAPKF
jgi:hypothetical protein